MWMTMARIDRTRVCRCAVAAAVVWMWCAGPAGAASKTRPQVCEAGAASGRTVNGGNEMTEHDTLTGEQGAYLISVARATIERRLFDKETKEVEHKDLPAIFDTRRGTFVTLTKEGALRGCIGHIIPREGVLDGVRENAINAAFGDPRFPPLSPAEWGKIAVEVSILTDPKPLSYEGGDDLLRKLRPGVDGVILRKGYHQATFLPQVWDQLPKTEDFLTHLCMKAGLAGNAWKKGDLEVSTYQVQAFEE